MSEQEPAAMRIDPPKRSFWRNLSVVWLVPVVALVVSLGIAWQTYAARGVQIEIIVPERLGRDTGRDHDPLPRRGDRRGRECPLHLRHGACRRDRHHRPRGGRYPDRRCHLLGGPARSQRARDHRPLHRPVRRLYRGVLPPGRGHRRAQLHRVRQPAAGPRRAARHPHHPAHPRRQPHLRGRADPVSRDRGRPYRDTPPDPVRRQRGLRRLHSGPARPPPDHGDPVLGHLGLHRVAGHRGAFAERGQPCRARDRGHRLRHDLLGRRAAHPRLYLRPLPR